MQHKIPVALSLVDEECDLATNHLKVIYNKLGEGEERKKFAVCSKGHTFPNVDKSVNLIEWIEILKSLGANIFVYHFDIHPNISKVLSRKLHEEPIFSIQVLNYYSSRGEVDVTEVTVPGPDFNIPILQFIYLMGNYPQDRAFLNFNAWIHWQDCLYRNIYRYVELSFIVYWEIQDICLKRGFAFTQEEITFIVYLNLSMITLSFGR